MRRHLLTLAILLMWFVLGRMGTALFFPIGLITILLWWRRRMYFELLLGFFFILILSDNLRHATDFAKVFKNVYMLLLAVICILSRRDFMPYNRIYVLFVPFLLLAVPGLLDSPVGLTGAQKTLSYLLLLFAIPQFVRQVYSTRGPQAIKDFIFFGVLMLLIGFLLRFTDPSVAISHGGRMRGVFGNPNGLGIFSTLMLVLVVSGREYFKGFFSKNDLRWMVIPIMAAVILSGSRTSIMAAILFLLFVRFFRSSPFLGFIVLLVAGVAVELISHNVAAIVEALGLSGYFRIETLDEGSGRYVAWAFAWEAIQERFWLGRGFAFDEWIMDVNQDFLNTLGHQGGVHNTYLILWLNTGLLGLLAFFRAFFLLFIRAAKHTPVAIPAMLLVMFSIALESWLAASLNPFTILLLTSLVLMTDPLFQPGATDLKDLAPQADSPHEKALA